jgi:hypothetical protein
MRDETLDRKVAMLEAKVERLTRRAKVMRGTQIWQNISITLLIFTLILQMSAGWLFK